MAYYYRQKANNRHNLLNRLNGSNTINKAVARGRIVKPTVCSTCGNGGPIQAHHYNGYDTKEQRYQIVWLCVPCHHAAHHPRPSPHPNSEDSSSPDW